MNRFEKPSILRKIQKLSLPLLGFILLFIVFIKGIASVSETTIDKQKESLTTALNRSITQCYAVEGTYPPSLEYIENHYGLTYNPDKVGVSLDDDDVKGHARELQEAGEEGSVEAIAEDFANMFGSYLQESFQGLFKDRNNGQNRHTFSIQGDQLTLATGDVNDLILTRQEE